MREIFTNRNKKKERKKYTLKEINVAFTFVNGLRYTIEKYLYFGERKKLAVKEIFEIREGMRT